MAWRAITLYSGLITSATDQTLTLAPFDFNDTVIPGDTKVAITNVTAMCVDTTKGRYFTLWKVADAGSIGDSYLKLYRFPAVQNVPVVAFSAANPWNAWIMNTGESIHVAASTANKIALEITALIDDFSRGEVQV